MKKVQDIFSLVLFLLTNALFCFKTILEKNNEKTQKFQIIMTITHFSFEMCPDFWSKEPGIRIEKRDNILFRAN